MASHLPKLIIGMAVATVVSVFLVVYLLIQNANFDDRVEEAVRGKDGKPGISITGKQGPRGKTGAKGEQGEPGARIIRRQIIVRVVNRPVPGPRGPRGRAGARVIIRNVPVPGPRGLQGIQGEPGADGLSPSIESVVSVVLGRLCASPPLSNLC